MISKIQVTTGRKYSHRALIHLRLIVAVVLLLFCQLGAADRKNSEIRLFFPAGQVAENDVNAIEGVNAEREKTAHDEISLEHKKENKTPYLGWLWFNGFIRNGSKFLVLINDLPCAVLVEESSLPLGNTMGVACRHIVHEDHSFRLHVDSRMLFVYRYEERIATLQVGQTL